MSNSLFVCSRRIIYFGFLCSILLLTLQGFEDIIGYWSYCVIPCAVSVLLVPLYTYQLILTSCPNIDSFSYELFQICSINMSLFISLFILLASMRLDQIISSSWCSIFISLWYPLLFYFAICIFMFPGLNSVNMGREAWLLLAWGIGITITSILIPIWIDLELENSWVVLVPITVICTCSALLYSIYIISGKTTLGRESLLYLITYALIIARILDASFWVFPLSGILLLAQWVYIEYENRIDYEEI